MRALQPHVGELNDEEFGILETVAQSISSITSPYLRVFLDTCIYRYHDKKIDTGTNIGEIDAQNVTLGVPHIKDILNAAKKISTPVITAKLKSNDNLSYAKLVKVQMEKTYPGQ
nr:DNA-directed RNA polymerase III subunit 1 [Tanacetum cinerariifolium]